MADDYTRFPPETRIYDPQTQALYNKLTKDGTYNLDGWEMWWRDHQVMLEAHGYLLRPRFRPGWVPSWLGTNIMPGLCEDAYMNVHQKTIDATRIADGASVFIKQIPAKTYEISIAQYLTREEVIRDPMNHCVPILDRFHDASERDIDFIAMPVLRRFDDPPFFSVSEIVDFISQTLQGLVFIHSQGIAHRDCSYLNIMMDAGALYPDGFHPSVKTMTPDGRGIAKTLRRCDASPVKYYFTDFGISKRFDDPAMPRLVTGRDGLDQEVPELSSHVPYDPFPVDIFILGNLYKKTFVDVYTNMPFLESLIAAMTQRDPKARPTAETALAQFNAIVSERYGYTLRWRLRHKDENLRTRVYYDISAAAREGAFLARQLLSHPVLFTTILLSASGSALSFLYGRRGFMFRLREIFGRFTGQPG